MVLNKQSERRFSGRRFLAIYLYAMFFLMGFISELGAIGANLAVMLLEFLFIISFLFFSGLKIKTELSKQAKVILCLVIAWVLWVLVISLYSLSIYGVKEGIMSWLRSFEYFFHILTAYCLYRLIPLNMVKFDKLLLLIPITCLLIALNMFFAWNLYPETHAPDLWLDTPPFYMNIRQGGFHASVGFFVAIAFLYENHLSKENKVKALTLSFYYFLALSMLIFLFWTGGRASTFVLYLALFIWIFSLRYSKLPIKKLLFCIVFLSVLAFFISQALSVMPWNGLLSAVERSTQSDNIERFGSGRTVVWQFVLEHIQNHYLFGLGSDSYYLAENSPTQFQPHNSILQFAMDWGVFGASLTIAILLLAFKNSGEFFLKNINRFSSFGFLSVLAMLITSLVDGTLYHGQTSFYFVLAMACMYIHLESNNIDGEKSVNALA